MKDYIKPTFTLAGLFPVALASSNCTMTESELQDFVDFGELDEFNFSVRDACKKTDSRVDAFCKFTAVGVENVMKVLNS